MTGPNLDEAFQQARKDGMKDSTFAGVVEGQIAHPNRNAQVDPKTGKTLPLMKPGIVKGEDARDVAAYVAQAVAESGDDPGRLAAVGASKAEGTATEQNGTLDIPVAASGLAYKFADATANAGQVTIKSENPQSTPHDIAIEGNGVNDKGEVVAERRRLPVPGRPQARRVHVLLLRARPPRGRHGRQAHRQVAAARTAEAITAIASVDG